jgi:hypothetical protein
MSVPFGPPHPSTSVPHRETCTHPAFLCSKHNNTNAVLPMISRAHIVQIDQSQMILKWDTAEGVESATNEVVFRKLGR